jgi:hypothetical protein
MTGAVRGGRLPSQRAEGALHPRGPAHRRSDARARPAPVAAAAPRVTDVRPPADPACSFSCASRRAPCRSPRRLARRHAARADPGVLTLKPGSTARRFGKPTRLHLTRGVGPGGRSRMVMGEGDRPLRRRSGLTGAVGSRQGDRRVRRHLHDESARRPGLGFRGGCREAARHERLRGLRRPRRADAPSADNARRGLTLSTAGMSLRN